MDLFLHRAKQEHLAFDYVAEGYPHDLIYPALSSQLSDFFNRNELSVPRNPFISELITLSEPEPPRLFEILICKQRGSRGRLGTLQIGMEHGFSTESLTYQKMGDISKRYCPDKPQIVMFIGMSFCLHTGLWSLTHFL